MELLKIFSVAIPSSLVVTLIVVVVAFWIEERRLRRVFKLDREAEQVARQLLKTKKWGKRSFKEIKKRLGGFEDDELRKILVRAGAVRFEKKEGQNDDNNGELWGLICRNKNDL